MTDQDYERIACMIIDAIQHNTPGTKVTLYVYLSNTDFTNTFQIQRTNSVDAQTHIRTKTILEYSYVGKDIHMPQVIAWLEKLNYPPTQWEVSYAHPMGKNMPHNPPTYYLTFSSPTPTPPYPPPAAPSSR